MTASNPSVADNSPFAEAWGLDPAIAMLNHGSFGACPRAVLQVQQRLRERMEQEPVRFFCRELQPLLDESRAALAQLVGADPQDLVFVRNATAGVFSASTKAPHPYPEKEATGSFAEAFQSTTMPW